MGRAPGPTHLAEEDADLAAVCIAPERGQACRRWDQLHQVLAAAVHLGLPAGDTDASAHWCLPLTVHRQVRGRPEPRVLCGGPLHSPGLGVPGKWAMLKTQGKSYFFLFKVFKMEAQLTYKVVLVSGVQDGT